jgi:hypothetical protein
MTNIDLVIMTNAEEESRLAELLADYIQQNPAIDPAEARQAVAIRVADLLQRAKVGMYELPLRGGSPPYRELPLSEALAVVAAPEQWEWEPPAGAGAFYPLFELDQTYLNE